MFYFALQDPVKSISRKRSCSIKGKGLLRSPSSFLLSDSLSGRLRLNLNPLNLVR